MRILINLELGERLLRIPPWVIRLSECEHIKRLAIWQDIVNIKKEQLLKQNADATQCN